MLEGSGGHENDRPIGLPYVGLVGCSTGISPGVVPHRLLSSNSAAHCSRRLAAISICCTDDPDAGAHLISSARCEPSSDPPAFAVGDWAANSLTLARIGPNGPNLCCSAGKASAYGPYGLLIGFCSRIG